MEGVDDSVMSQEMWDPGSIFMLGQQHCDKPFVTVMSPHLEGRTGKVHQEDQLVHQQDDYHCHPPKMALRGVVKHQPAARGSVWRSLSPLQGKDIIDIYEWMQPQRALEACTAVKDMDGHTFFYEWTLEAPLGANVREERRAPGLQGLVKDNICLIL
ncbi:unnamed protein product [Tetraodon nigroviridis]|uniref:(spotted green pufferfish) hypothetical protein n=1 Tax=Tetraodon nigroviridis TaxID=99883 RepID=Q4SMC0_TETNG|nr:unnamed protein product [Tetraodon nigroviridis]